MYVQLDFCALFCLVVRNFFPIDLKKKENKMNWNEFISFEKMITPVLIKILFWIGVVVCVIGGLGTIITSANSLYGSGMGVLSGLLIIIIGPILVRVWCEILMVLFNINNSLTDIKHLQEKRQVQ